MQVRVPKPKRPIDKETMNSLYFDARGRYCPHKSERRQEQLIADRAKRNATRRIDFYKKNPVTPELYSHAITMIGNAMDKVEQSLKDKRK